MFGHLIIFILDPKPDKDDDNVTVEEKVAKNMSKIPKRGKEHA